MKSEVYSWRLAPETKEALEHRARARGVSVSELLDSIVGEWLEAAPAGPDEDQARLQAAAERSFGVLARGESATAARVREVVRRSFEARRGRRRPA